jgi:hypothetical protein
VARDVAAERAVGLLTDRLTAEDHPRELAVLARVNSALLPVQVALTEAGVPHTAPLDATVLGRTGVRTAWPTCGSGWTSSTCAATTCSTRSTGPPAR